MSFNIPITLHGDVSEDGITRESYGRFKLGSVDDLTQVQLELNEQDDMSAYRCAHCGEELNEADPRETLADGDTECSSANEGDPHRPENVPLTWARNILIDLDEENDRIDLSIATGEPRGGWQMRLWRNPETGKVMMTLPHADMDAPHEPIREIHPGTFEIG